VIATVTVTATDTFAALLNIADDHLQGSTIVVVGGTIYPMDFKGRTSIWFSLDDLNTHSGYLFAT